MTDRVAALARLAAEAAPGIVELRRDLHRHPEVGWHEHRTTSVVADAVHALGLDPKLRHDGVGLVAEIGEGERAVGFRADLDALPIDELSGAPYASVRPGAMHACGHDVHAAIGVGILTVLAGLDMELPGRVRLLFQPAEELIPGGATAMCREGVHADLSAIVAFHVDPSLPAGKVGVRAGGITGASDRVVIRLSGQGGHTSRPHQTVDLVYVAARLVTDLPVLVRHGIDPRETALVVFGQIHGGDAENVIPARVAVGGTVRLFDLELWREMPRLVEKAVLDLVTPFGATAEVEYTRGSPPVVNDRVVIDTIHQAAVRCLGETGVAGTHQSLGSEDFAWFLEDVPGALVRLGAALPDRRVDLHSASFDIDEDAIETGIFVGAEMLLELLERA